MLTGLFLQILNILVEVRLLVQETGIVEVVIGEEIKNQNQNIYQKNILKNTLDIKVKKIKKDQASQKLTKINKKR